MTVQFYGENIEFTEAMKEYFNTKFKKVIDKIKYEEAAKIKVNLKKGHNYQKIEISMYLAHHNPVHIEEKAENAYAAMDQIIPKIERQIRKIKTKEHKNYY